MKTFFLTPGLTFFICGALLFTSCKKDQVSVKSANAQLTFGAQADNTNLSLSSTTTTTAGIVWTSAIANVTAFKFEAKKQNTEIEIKTKNLTNINLFSVNPSLIGALIDTGTYREIEIKIMLTKSSSANIPLVLKGSFTTAGGAVVPIELDFNDDAIIKAEAENITVNGKANFSVIIALHLNSLLKNISLAALDHADRSNNTIIISNSSNETIYNLVKANITAIGEARHFESHDKGDDKGNGNENQSGDDKGSDG